MCCDGLGGKRSCNPGQSRTTKCKSLVLLSHSLQETGTPRVEDVEDVQPIVVDLVKILSKTSLNHCLQDLPELIDQAEHYARLSRVMKLEHVFYDVLCVLDCLGPLATAMNLTSNQFHSIPLLGSVVHRSHITCKSRLRSTAETRAAGDKASRKEVGMAATWTGNDLNDATPVVCIVSAD